MAEPARGRQTRFCISGGGGETQEKLVSLAIPTGDQRDVTWIDAVAEFPAWSNALA